MNQKALEPKLRSRQSANICPVQPRLIIARRAHAPHPPNTSPRRRAFRLMPARNLRKAIHAYRPVVNPPAPPPCGRLEPSNLRARIVNMRCDPQARKIATLQITHFNISRNPVKVTTPNFLSHQQARSPIR